MNFNKGRKKGRRKSIQRTTWGNQKKRKSKKSRFKDLENCIVNLSNFDLTDDMKRLLIKGLNFCPTPQPDHISQVLTDILIFERRCRLKLDFIDRPEDDNRDKFTPTSWTPLAGKSTGLDTFLTATKEEILDQVIGECGKNLTMAELEALKQLRDDEHIEIKPAPRAAVL